MAARPTREQRLVVLKSGLAGSGFSDRDLGHLADATGEVDGRHFGFTYSDLTQRLIPTLVPDAFPERAIIGSRAVEIAKDLKPTPPFREQAATGTHGGQHGR